MKQTALLSCLLLLISCDSYERRIEEAARQGQINVRISLYDQSRQDSDLGLNRIEGMETVTVFTPEDSTDHYSNGVCLTGFKGRLYCMWQSSKDDEDSADTWVAYSTSADDGKTWTRPMVLAGSPTEGMATSGGWHVNGDELVAYVNVWNESHTEGQAFYIASTDGELWTGPQPVLMHDGTPMTGVIEQDPHTLGSGRLMNAAHFSPGLQVCPIYTDDKSGKTGWHKASFTTKRKDAAQSRELEPSSFVKADGTLVMIFRDQCSSFHKLAATSGDRGETWTSSFLTDIPDSRSKQCAGNLPDGTAYFVSNPVENKMRWPLVITLSDDGTEFNRASLLRSYEDLPDVRYEGLAKRKGYVYPKSCIIGNQLYVSYSVNKEIVQYVRVPLEILSNRTLHCHGSREPLRNPFLSRLLVVSGVFRRNSGK